MEFRKLIAFGKTSYVMSIPKQWVLKNNMKKGDLISLDENEGKLVLSPRIEEEGEKIEKAEINVSKLDPAIVRFIHAIYKRGADEIAITFDKPEQLSTIQQMISEDMIGFEITSQERNHCTIKAIAREFDQEFDSMLRRTFLVLKSMSHGIVESMENEDLDSIPNLQHLESINNKYTGFCRRILNKHGFKEKQKNVTFMYCTVEELEKLADQYKYLCDYFTFAKKNIKNINKDVIKLYKDTSDLFEGFYNVFYKFELNKAVELFKKRKSLVKETEKFLNSDSKQEIMLAHYLIVIIQLIANLTSFKIEMAL